jgi:hypothetical protein
LFISVILHPSILISFSWLHSSLRLFLSDIRPSLSLLIFQLYFLASTPSSSPSVPVYRLEFQSPQTAPGTHNSKNFLA